MIAGTAAVIARAAIEAEKAELRLRIASLDRRLERLRRARNDLSSARDTVRELRDEIRRNGTPDRVWRGARCNEYEIDMGHFFSIYRQYYSHIGNAISSIRRRITQLEIERVAAQMRLRTLQLIP